MENSKFGKKKQQTTNCKPKKNKMINNENRRFSQRISSKIQIHNNEKKVNVKKIEPLINKTTSVNLQENSFECNVCGKQFRNKSLLMRHNRMHIGEKPFQCDICGQSFSEHTAVEIHKRNEHTQENFSCNKCNITYPEQRLLKLHNVRLHQEKTNNFEESIKRKSYICNICNRIFNHRANHYKHMQMDLHEYNCADCNIGTFTDYQQYIEHKTEHASEKPFKCKSCPKSFRSRRFLTEHEMVHTGEKPFKCLHCPKAFALKRNLRVHLRIHATIRRTYQCRVCAKVLNTAMGLKYHETNIHSSERIYQCSVCFKTFSNSLKLAKHRRKQHKEYLESNETSTN